MANRDQARADLGLADHKQETTLKIQVLDVSPDMAATWLKNLHPRQHGHLIEGTVASLVREMKTGNWRLTHQGIALDECGRLIDGQNRLTALVRAHMTLKMVVAFGVPEEHFPKIDGNTPRSVAFRTGLPPQVAPIVAQMVRLARYGSSGVRISDTMMAVAHDFGSDALRYFSERASRTTRQRFTTAPVRAGVVLNLIANKADDGYKALIIDAYNALVSGNITAAPGSAASLFVRMTTSGRSSFPSMVQVAYSWRAFDPAHFADKRLVIRDVGDVLREIREGVLRTLSEVLRDEDEKPKSKAPKMPGFAYLP